MFWRASRHLYIVPHLTMGIDKSLTDDFPSVTIEGRKYHYGRESVYGQYLVEDAEYAKNYWCFDTKEDLQAFLIMLPESADRDWATRKHPNWHDVFDDQRSLWIDERKKEIRELAEKRKKEKPGVYFNVLQFDDNVLQFDDADWYFASGERRLFDDVVIRCESQELAQDQREWIVTLVKGNPYGPDSDATILKFSREQAIKIATALLRAASDARRHQENG